MQRSWILRLSHKGSRVALIIVALLLFVPQFLVWSQPGSFDLSELAACAGLILLYKVLHPILSRLPLTSLLYLTVFRMGFVLLFASLAVTPIESPDGEEEGSPDHSVDVLHPSGMEEPLQAESSWVSTIESLAHDGGQAIRNSGIFSGSGTFGTTLGAVGDVTSTTAEVLIRTVYSGSNVVREDSIVMSRDLESRGKRPLPLLALIAAAVLSVTLLASLRVLVMVERKKGTLGRFRFLVLMVFLQVFYITLGIETLVYNSLSGLESNVRMLLSISPFYVLLILAAIINGFRVKWIHYLNRWRKYVALIGALLMLVLSQAILSLYFAGSLTVASAAIGTFIGCIATVTLFYSTVAAISILLHLPSARLVDRKLEQLRILDGLGQSIFSTFDEQRIMAASVILGRKIARADECWTVRFDGSGFPLWEEAPVEHGRHSTDYSVEWYAEMLLRLQAENGTILINGYPGTDLADIAGPSAPAPGSLLASLLRVRKEIIGIIIATSDKRYAFLSESKGLFGTFARQVAAGIENTRLISAELEQERYREELLIARSIQEGLLPGELPIVESFDIAGLSVPSSQVGGDYYDLFRMPDGLCGFAIADVAGKGTAAALLMAALESALHAIAPGIGKDAGAVVSRLNNLMTQRMPDDKFITFFFGVLDPLERTISYCCAGHDPPLLLRLDGSTEHLDQGGLVLGIVDNAKYETGQVTLNRGDRLLLYTDGITETMDGEGEGTEFGVENLKRFLGRHSELSSRDLLNTLLVTLRDYRGDETPFDDMTLLLIGETSGRKQLIDGE